MVGRRGQAAPTHPRLLGERGRHEQDRAQRDGKHSTHSETLRLGTLLIRPVGRFCSLGPDSLRPAHHPAPAATALAGVPALLIVVIPVPAGDGTSRGSLVLELHPTPCLTHQLTSATHPV